MPSISHQPTLAGFDDEPQAKPSTAPKKTTADCQPTDAADLTGKTVYVVDSHSLIYQVFHALPEMTGPSGQPVGAVQGFVRDLLDLIEVRGADYLICAFDRWRADVSQRDLRPVQDPPRRDAGRLAVADSGDSSGFWTRSGILSLSVRGLRGGRHPGDGCQAGRSGGRAVPARDERQGLPAAHHRPRAALQHSQERNLRRRRPASRRGAFGPTRSSIFRRSSATRPTTFPACR